jgi:protein-L-isoaspartate(D-aspartate) O-methyltransferase
MGKLDLELRAALIQSVRHRESYLQMKPDRDERVFQALERVDRQTFIPEEALQFVEVDPSVLRNLYDLLRIATKDRPANFSEFADHALVSLFRSARTYIIPLQALAYNDTPVVIGENQTCSEPSMVAFMTDLLELQDGMRVLEVGTGCGYHAAVVSEMLPGGRVVSLEFLPKLADLARTNLRTHFGDTLDKRLTLVEGDGSIGYAKEAPYDRIYLTAAAGDAFSPEVLARQLNPDCGILLYPSQRGFLMKQHYTNKKLVHQETFDDIAFVPLVGENS